MADVQSLGSREGPSDIVRRYGSVDIIGGNALSAAFLTERARTLFVQTPSGWDAAAITLEGSMDGTTFAPVNNLAGELASSSITAQRVVGPFDITGLKSIKVRSGTSAAPVNQADTVTLFVAVSD